MSTETCINHPERAAIEHCEVCHEPLCAYCLYYTSDGQRLCQAHADQAAASGAYIRAPGVYANGLIPTQVEADRKPKEPTAALYEGNTADLIAFIGLLLGVVSIAACIPGLNCLIGPVGLVVSLVAFFNAREARNRSRTRTLAGLGAGLSALMLIIGAACIFWYFGQIATLSTSFSNLQLTIVYPGSFPRSQPTVVVVTSAPPTQVPSVAPSATSAPGR